MSKDGNDFYKACIGAADNFMSVYYQEKFRKIDEAAKKDRERITNSGFSFGYKKQEEDEDDFSFGARSKPEPAATNEEENKSGQASGGEDTISFLKVFLTALFVFAAIGLLRS